MPKIVPFMPSSDVEKVKLDAVKLIEAASAVGVSMDLQGFVTSWLSDSVRVVVAYEEDKVTGFGLMSSGRRYFDDKLTASILVAQGPARKDVLQYLLEMARILGAQLLFYEGTELGGGLADMRVVQVV